jgi:hypothetical protein
MKTIKCLVDLGVKGQRIRAIELHNRDDLSALREELQGTLPYMPEFRTTKGEIVIGTQIISLAIEG